MQQAREQWDSGDADDFWAPTLSQRLTARRDAEREAFAVGWSRVFYVAAAVLVLAAVALVTLR